MKRLLRRLGCLNPTLPVFLGLTVMILSLGLTNVMLWGTRFNFSSNSPPSPALPTPPEVLGSWYQKEPAIMISGGEGWSANGGVIALASTDEPSVTIESYRVTGDVTVKLYPATEAQLFAYLTYNDDYQQINPAVTPSTNPITEFTYTLPGENNQGSPLVLPLEPSGLYHLNISNGSAHADAFVIRSQTGVLVKEGDNQFVFWGQDYQTKRSLNQGTIRILSAKNQATDLTTAVFNDSGIATAPISYQADFAWVSRDADRALVPLNLKYLNSRYQSSTYVEKYRHVKHFVFTDRPLYQPGDPVYFKAVIRDDDDARYTLPTSPVTIRVSNGYGNDQEVIYENTYSVNSFGSIDGQFKLPQDVKTTYYTITLDPGPTGKPDNYYDYDSWSDSHTSFQVEFYRKPDYFLTVTSDKNEYIAGDSITYTLQGQYFSGQPLTYKSVDYELRTSSWGDYDYHVDATFDKDNYRYGRFGSDKLESNRVRLDDKGQAKVTLPAKNHEGKSQLYTLTTKLVDETGTADEAFKNVLVYSGEFGLYRTDYAYGFTIGEPIAVPLKAVSRLNQSVANLTLNVKSLRSWYEKQPLQTGEKYHRYLRQTEDLPNQTLKTDTDGQATLNLTPQKGGNYEFTVTGQDNRGNQVVKSTSVWVNDTTNPVYFEEYRQGLDLSVDTKLAQPDGSVKLTLISDIPDRDIFLGFERDRLNRFQIIRLTGTSTTETIPLTLTDMPNIFLTASSFSTDWLDTDSLNLPIDTAQKHLVVHLTPNEAQYGPGDTVNLNLVATDKLGRPVSAELAVWAVDKAIFELVDPSNLNIFNAFWRERYDTTPEDHSLEGITVLTAEGGGCFVGDTPILMADGTQQPISQVRSGDHLLTRISQTDPTLVPALVTSTHHASDTGYLTINGVLKVTVNHKLWVNQVFTEAGTIMVGDVLVDSGNRPVVVETIEYTRLKVPVYNLEVANYHTFFAGGVWVHNQKGEARSIFKDTAYWNPRVVTDNNGRAQLSFKLPDNLTTWTIAAVGTSLDTIAGDAKQDIVVSKDIIVRPVLPNLLRLGDQATVRALLHNFSDKKYTFNLDLAFDSGDIDTATRSGLVLEPNDFAQVEFKVKPIKVTDAAKFRFRGLSVDDPKVNDIITVTIPIRPFGFYDSRGSASAQGNHTFNLVLPVQIDPDLSTITLNLAPTLLGTLPQAMQFLLDYPYGCVEQTTSRFVPLVIAKTNPDLFSQALLDQDTDAMVKKGIERLTTLQNPDGGWGWWSEGNSDPFITAYVIEYLVTAQKYGLAIPQELIDRAADYYDQATYLTESQGNRQLFAGSAQVAKAYALTFLSETRDRSLLNQFDHYPPDLLSWAVITNVKNSHTDSNQNGAHTLLAKAIVQGDGLSWSAGEDSHFGSVDATTAMAVRALTAAGLKNDAYKGVLYLTRSRTKPYWSNTFATAQVAQALVDYGRSGTELTPNYTYTVTLDGQTLKTGQVTSKTQVIPPLTVPVASLKSSNPTVAVAFDGEGQLYSTLSQKILITDPQSSPVTDGIAVTREYVNDKDPTFSLGVGDTVSVRLTVNNPGNFGAYAVIDDELPAGLVPINPAFNNESSGRFDRYGQGVWGQEITENGMILSLAGLDPGNSVFTYKARVVTEGSYLTPPARVHLMYAPEVYARTGSETVTIDREAVFDPARAVRNVISPPAKRPPWLIIGVGVSIVIILISLFVSIWYRRRHRSKVQPPLSPPSPSSLPPTPVPPAA